MIYHYVATITIVWQSFSLSMVYKHICVYGKLFVDLFLLIIHYHLEIKTFSDNVIMNLVHSKSCHNEYEI